MPLDPLISFKRLTEVLFISSSLVESTNGSKPASSLTKMPTPSLSAYIYDSTKGTSE